jgi:Chaperone of endosialidase
MAPNGSSWAPLSDANAKENFREVDGEALLAKLAAMSIQEWNYKAQDASIRHMGPTAQEFRAAFGLGDFPLRINTVDADGVALAGVKALDARTREQNERLTEENAGLRAEIAIIRERLERLERLLSPPVTPAGAARGGVR